MTLNRRDFIKFVAASTSTTLLPKTTLAQVAKIPKIKAIAFDGFPIFDPRPIFSLAETLYPGKGKDLSQAWRTRQFEYQWLRALSGQYVDFWQATEDGLSFAVKQLKLEPSQEKMQRLMDAYLNLKPWPDVIPALRSLRSSNIRLVFLSNLTPNMLTTNMRNSGLEDFFEHAISTDRIKTYKPDPRAYQLGVDTLQLKREEIAFAAFAGWDAAGAKWFGYPTFWVNRAGFDAEKLGVTPDGTGKGMEQLVQFIKSYNNT
jgi:2-haloacid dehalogenase